MTESKIRQACFHALDKLVAEFGSVLGWNTIAQGFQVEEETVFFGSKAHGIFKPRLLTDGAALSIKSVQPSRAGRRAPYNDSEVFDGVFEYRLERSGRDNRLLLEAQRLHLPLVYFRGISDAQYEVIYPVFVERVDETNGTAVVVCIEDAAEKQVLGRAEDSEIPKGYIDAPRKQRLHQRAFRDRVLRAYRNRCAISGLPIPQLLEACHIIDDSKGGMPWVRNGIALSRLHHAAYQQNLLGIDPRNRVHVSRRLLDVVDGPLLSEGLQRWNGSEIQIPIFPSHQPSKELLAARFDEYMEANR